MMHTVRLAAVVRPTAAQTGLALAQE